MTPGQRTSILSAFCILSAGCTNSDLVAKVADQAAEVAKLEVELQTSKQALEAIKGELKQARASLATAEEKSQLEKVASAKLRAEHEANAKEVSELQKQLQETKTKFLSAQNRLDEVEAARHRQQKIMDIVGVWALPGKPALSEKNNGVVFQFRPDGSGVYHERNEYRDMKHNIDVDYEITFSPTQTLGSYQIDGTTKPSTLYERAAGRIRGTFRIDSDGKTAVLEGWDTETAPRQYARRDGDEG